MEHYSSDGQGWGLSSGRESARPRGKRIIIQDKRNSHIYMIYDDLPA